MIKFTSGIWIELTDRNFHRYQADFESELAPGNRIYVPNCEITLDDTLRVVSIVTEKEILMSKKDLDMVQYQLSKM